MKPWRMVTGLAVLVLAHAGALHAQTVQIDAGRMDGAK